MEKFFGAVQNMFKIPELRRRILFTLGLLAVYRFGAHVQAPGINKVRLEQVWGEVAGTLLGVLDLFSGGNFRTISVFALGVTPYITASIIMQLMPVLSPAIKKIQEEGEVGRQKMNQWTRYLTVVLCSVQTFFVATWLHRNGIIAETWWATSMVVITLTTGTIFVMWLGEQITERGVGNGISLLIFAGIVIGLPRGLTQISDRVSAGDAMQTLGVLFLVIVIVALIALIVYVESARRNIAISYANRRVGNQTVRGQETSLPLKINMGGVIPVIFASSVLALPQTMFSAFPPDPNAPNSMWSKVYAFMQQFHGGDPYYELFFLSMIVLFTFFYITIIFNTDEVADNLRKHGGFIAGIRPGAPTAEYLNGILTRLTTVGALYLAFVAFAPQLLLSGFKVARLPFIGTALDNFFTSTPGLSWIPTGLGYQFYFGGTSLLILVGVAMDTVSQIEAQLVMRNYEGFLGAGSKLRGRRS
ncbi:MAG TPA: preprotein translocase subunit SecY [Pyrinomonadaceae bacterium]|nr:preprotein translocase subunit SecY [Chloracidobacterium sp.]MBP9934547.1 preprotein translocase subunit SecY [Pyrinomonadaceae bacterium]MBK7802453.1 preprotein translocase subunit SecY [Chloracidobacterium sp.]MBL0239995.1 preprotein translocase subunit SecY [Chloracidobacterium sp.]HQX55078.1 preprotein translocase subunit SecY [Pyrinomonadaceae bacterium]